MPADLPYELLRGALEAGVRGVRSKMGVDPDSRVRLPRAGSSWEEVERELAALRDQDTPEAFGRLSLYSLKGSSEVQAVCEKAHRMFFSRNALFAPYLPSVARMQIEVLDMCLGLLNAPSEAAANLTSGGSESLYCAIHAARDWAREHLPGAETPEIVAPYSIHAAFDKGCALMGLRLVRVPLARDYRADIAAMRSSITKNTIMIAASAPCWPFGLYDDIPALAELASSKGLWMHVDACLGGYLAPFAEAVGHPVPPWDFRIAGVTSISADLHKYGFAAKPCSTILWNHADLRRHHYQPITNWPCGLYLSEALLGSRPAGAVASAWAVMHFLGQEGYERLARAHLAVAAKLREGVEQIGPFRTWPSELAVFAFGSDEIDIRRVVAGMTTRGWFMMGNQEPPLVHMTLDAVSEAVLDAFLADLAQVTAEVRSGQATAVADLTYT